MDCRLTNNNAILADPDKLGYGRRWFFHDRMAKLCALNDWDEFSASTYGWNRESHRGLA